MPAFVYHGTTKQIQGRLTARVSDEGWPFGPAIYTSADAEIARCYAGYRGKLYRLKLLGNPELCIDLDAPWQRQSVLARQVMLRLLSTVGVDRGQLPKDARGVIDLAVDPHGKRWRNDFLRENGIWMIHGHLDQTERSGRRDQGRQYAVLDDAAIVECVTVLSDA